MYKISTAISILLLSSSVSAGETVYKFNMKFVDGIREIKVLNSGGRYFVNGKTENSSKSIAKHGQEFPLDYNKSGYSSVISDIGYGIYLLKDNNGILYPDWSDHGEYFINESKLSGNSIIIETRKEDVGSFKFFLKYDYNPEHKKILLSDIYYESKSNPGEEEDGWFSFYRVDISTEK